MKYEVCLAKQELIFHICWQFWDMQSLLGENSSSFKFCQILSVFLPSGFKLFNFTWCSGDGTMSIIDVENISTNVNLPKFKLLNWDVAIAFTPDFICQPTQKKLHVKSNTKESLSIWVQCGPNICGTRFGINNFFLWQFLTKICNPNVHDESS